MEGDMTQRITSTFGEHAWIFKPESISLAQFFKLFSHQAGECLANHATRQWAF
jgi:hypothetical protein